MQQILSVHILQRETDLNQPAQDLLFIQVRSSIGLLFKPLVQVTRLAVVCDDAHIGSMLEGVFATVGWSGDDKQLVKGSVKLWSEASQERVCGKLTSARMGG